MNTDYKHVWAFAKERQDTERCIITACSKEAKVRGIRAGMYYEDAKSLLPEIRILVIGGPNI